MDHYSYYCYTHLVRGSSAEETLCTKEAYERLEATHRSRVCAYRADNGRSQSPYSRRQSKPADNILATAGWDITTKT